MENQVVLVNSLYAAFLRQVVLLGRSHYLIVDTTQVTSCLAEHSLQNIIIACHSLSSFRGR